MSHAAESLQAMLLFLLLCHKQRYKNYETTVNANPKRAASQMLNTEFNYDTTMQLYNA